MSMWGNTPPRRKDAFKRNKSEAEEKARLAMEKLKRKENGTLP